MRSLRAEYDDKVPRSVAALVAGLFGVLGLIALVTVMIRV
jgi:hypothetical protein